MPDFSHNLKKGKEDLMSNKQETQGKEEVKNLSQEFANKYNELCREYGLQIVFEPRWVQSKDQGDYRLQIVYGIGQLPTQE